MNKNEPIRYLSMAAKAGAVVSGGDEVEKTLRRGRGYLLVVACDAGGNAERRALTLAKSKNIRLEKIPYTKSELAAALGRGSSVAIALVTDRGLASAFAEAAGIGSEQEEQI